MEELISRNVDLDIAEEGDDDLDSDVEDLRKTPVHLSESHIELRKAVTENFIIEVASLKDLAISAFTKVFHLYWYKFCSLPKNILKNLINFIPTNVDILKAAVAIGNDNVYWRKRVDETWPFEYHNKYDLKNKWKNYFLEKKYGEYIDSRDPEYFDYDWLRKLVQIYLPFINNLEITQLKVARYKGRKECCTEQADDVEFSEQLNKCSCQGHIIKGKLCFCGEDCAVICLNYYMNVVYNIDAEFHKLNFQQMQSNNKVHNLKINEIRKSIREMLIKKENQIRMSHLKREKKLFKVRERIEWRRHEDLKQFFEKVLVKKVNKQKLSVPELEIMTEAVEHKLHTSKQVEQLVERKKEPSISSTTSEIDLEGKLGLQAKLNDIKFKNSKVKEKLIRKVHNDSILAKEFNKSNHFKDTKKKEPGVKRKGSPNIINDFTTENNGTRSKSGNRKLRSDNRNEIFQRKGMFKQKSLETTQRFIQKDILKRKETGKEKEIPKKKNQFKTKDQNIIESTNKNIYKRTEIFKEQQKFLRINNVKQEGIRKESGKVMDVGKNPNHLRTKVHNIIAGIKSNEEKLAGKNYLKDDVYKKEIDFTGKEIFKGKSIAKRMKIEKEQYNLRKQIELKTNYNISGRTKEKNEYKRKVDKGIGNLKENKIYVAMENDKFKKDRRGTEVQNDQVKLKRIQILERMGIKNNEDNTKIKERIKHKKESTDKQGIEKENCKEIGGKQTFENKSGDKRLKVVQQIQTLKENIKREKNYIRKITLKEKNDQQIRVKGNFRINEEGQIRLQHKNKRDFKEIINFKRKVEITKMEENQEKNGFKNNKKFINKIMPKEKEKLKKTKLDIGEEINKKEGAVKIKKPKIRENLFKKEGERGILRHKESEGVNEKNEKEENGFTEKNREHEGIKYTKGNGIDEIEKEEKWRIEGEAESKGKEDVKENKVDEEAEETERKKSIDVDVEEEKQYEEQVEEDNGVGTKENLEIEKGDIRKQDEESDVSKESEVEKADKETNVEEEVTESDEYGIWKKYEETDKDTGMEEIEGTENIDGEEELVESDRLNLDEELCTSSIMSQYSPVHKQYKIMSTAKYEYNRCKFCSYPYSKNIINESEIRPISDSPSSWNVRLPCGCYCKCMKLPQSRIHLASFILPLVNLRKLTISFGLMNYGERNKCKYAEILHQEFFCFIMSLLNLKLEHFKIHFCELDEGHAEILFTGCKLMHSLEILEVINCNLTDEGVKQIKHLFQTQENPLRLKVLNLSGNLITSVGATLIGEFLTTTYPLPIIKSVDLSNNDIGTSGVEAMAKAISKNFNIEILGLCQTNIETTGIITLSQTLRKNSSLKHLDTSCNLFEQEAESYVMSAIKRNKTIENWNLKECGLTKEIIDFVNKKILRNLLTKSKTFYKEHPRTVPFYKRNEIDMFKKIKKIYEEKFVKQLNTEESRKIHAVKSEDLSQLFGDSIDDDLSSVTKFIQSDMAACTK